MERLLKTIHINGEAVKPAITAKISRTSISQLSDEDENSNSEEENESEKSKSTVTEFVHHKSPSFHKSTVTALEAEFEYLKNSEISYVESLKYIQDVKTNTELKYSTNLLTQLKFYHVFYQIDELLRIHLDFLSNLRLSSNVTIAKAISIFDLFTVKFKLYIDYISNILSIDSALNSNSEFFKENGPQLGENLRKPRMRLNYYVLVLESFQKKASANEKQMLQNQIDQLKYYLRKSNTKLVIETVNECKIELSSCGEFIMSSDLSVKKGEGFNHRKYLALLFEAAVIFARGNPDKCFYKENIWIKDVEILHEMRGVLIHLRVKRDERYLRYIFKAKTIKLQQSWIHSLKKQIEKLCDIPETNLVQTRPAPTSATMSSACRDLSSARSLPPLTLNATFPCFYTEISKDLLLEQCNAHLIESVQSVITSLSTLLEPEQSSPNRKKLFGLQVDLEKLHELHKNIFMPGLISYINNNCKDLETLQESNALVFEELKLAQPLYEKILYMAAVFKYELRNSVSNSLEAICHNFILFSKIIQRWKFNDDCWQEIEELVKETVSNVSVLLKRKYVRNCPSNMCIQSFCEGFLNFNEIELSPKLIYAILTRNHFTILEVNEESFIFSRSIATDRLKLLQCSSLDTLFKIKVIDGNREEIYSFSSETCQEKDVWINTLGTLSKYY